MRRVAAFSANHPGHVSPPLSIRPLLHHQMVYALGVLIVAFVALTTAPGANAADLTGKWTLNGEGFVGDLIVRQTPGGELSGFIYDGENMQGFHATQTSDVVLLRGPAEHPTQAFVGTVDTTGKKIAGFYYELTPGAQGANRYRFTAEQGTTAPPPLLPDRIDQLGNAFVVRAPVSVAGRHTVFNRPSVFGRSQGSPLVLNQAGDGSLTGVYGEGLLTSKAGKTVHSVQDTLVGHYAASTGRTVFLRMHDNLPFQLYVGKADGAEPLRAGGVFYALTPGAGARAGGMKYDWTTVVPKTADLTSLWKINGNGSPGDLDLIHAADGTLSGHMYNGDRIQGFYSPKERIAVILRGHGPDLMNRPHQAYIGHVSEDGNALTGNFYTLNTTSGGNWTRNVFSFAARRGTNQHPTVLPGFTPNAGQRELSSWIYRICNRPAEFGTSQCGILRLTVDSNPMSPTRGSLSGPLSSINDGDFLFIPSSDTVWDGDIYGHYTTTTGSVAFIRLRHDRPFQLFVGDVVDGPESGILFRRAQGYFYTLTSEAGASAERIKFDWFAESIS